MEINRKYICIPWFFQPSLPEKTVCEEWSGNSTAKVVDDDAQQAGHLKFRNPAAVGT